MYMLTQKQMELNNPSKVETYKNINPMPQKMILGYAVTQVDSPLMQQLSPDKEQLERFSPCKHMSNNLPKTYAWACEDDSLVPYENTLKWGEAMKEAGLDCRCRIFPTGGHGIAAGYGTSAEGWLNDMFEYFSSF